MSWDKDDPTNPKTGAIKITKVPEPKSKNRDDCVLSDHLDPRNRKSDVYEATLAGKCKTLLPIIVSIDGSASMKKIPTYLQKYLHGIFDSLISQGIDCPNVMIMSHDDEHAVPPDAAFQMSGFLENKVALSRTINDDVFFTGCGGGNKGEAYHLPFYAAANHTNFKAEGKGFLFIIGDEEPYYGAGDPAKRGTSPEIALEIFGDVLDNEVPMLQSVKKAAEKYHIFVIRPLHTNNGPTQKITKAWQKLFELAGVDSDNVLEPTDTVAILPAMAYAICLTRGDNVEKLEAVLKEMGVKNLCSARATVANLMAKKHPGGAPTAPSCG